MVKKPYDWKGGAELGEHSKRKHKILREYFFKYLMVKCSHPQQSYFHIAIVDGFSGGGRYKCGSPGSPLIFIEELKHAYEAINLFRSEHRLKAIDFDCFMICNDTELDAINCLKENITPYVAEIKETCPGLKIKVEFSIGRFEENYFSIKEKINNIGVRNVIFNLDQCGYTHVSKKVIVDIMGSFKSVEIFYTFVIEAFLKFATKSNIDKLKQYLAPLGISYDDLLSLPKNLGKIEWLGAAEKMIFDNFRTCAEYLSPFSINHDGGYKYWFMHFSNNYRARQEYNNVLHDNAHLQAHYGRSGLNMLSYNSADEGNLYLFNVDDRKAAKAQLYYDIPSLISKFGNVISVNDFYTNIYNSTPAHSNDIHEAIMENPDLEVITESGGERQKANTIKPNDIIKLTKQKSFFMLFGK